MLSRKQLMVGIFWAITLSGSMSWLISSPWIALPLGIIFALIVPGILVMLLIKREIHLNLETLLFIIGLGLSFIIFATLIEDITLRAFGVSRPLTSNLLFITVAILNLIALGLGRLRWTTQPMNIKITPFSKYDLITIAYSIILLLGFIGGAIRLNNNASGWLSIACYLGVVGLVICLFIFNKILKQSSIIFSLWIAGLGILFSGWLRSGYVAGPDLDKEYQIFLLIKHSGYWSIDLYRSPYNACLSINLLPTALSFFTKLSDMLVFKLLMPALYSLIIPIVFLISRVQLKKRGAILATFFFFSQPPFVTWWWIPIRQEMALLFFGLLVLLLLQGKRDRGTQMLFLILGASMIVSHYSTSYIAIGLFLFYRLMISLIDIAKKFKPISPHLLKYSFILIFFLFTFFWYSQVTTGFGNATQFVTKSFQNIGSLFSSDVQQQGQGPLDHLNIFSTAGSAALSPFNYANNQKEGAQKLYSNSQLYGQNYGLQAPRYTPDDSTASQNLSNLRNLLKVLGNLLISLGVVVAFIVAWRAKNIKTVNLLQLAGLLFLLIAMFLPFFSISYGEDRLYQQLLIFASGATAAAFSLKFRGRLKHVIQWGLLGFVIVYFLILNQVLQQFTVSSQQSMALSNKGNQYLEYYVSTQDVNASKWLSANRNPLIPIYGDNYSQYRLVTDAELSLLTEFRTGVLPDSLPRNSYVYQSTTNTQTQTAFDSDEGLILYKFPVDFLSSQKDQIYSNNSDIIYR